jgi:hypothetical protein
VAAPSALATLLGRVAAFLSQAEGIMSALHDAALEGLAQLYASLTDVVDALYQRGLSALEAVRRGLGLRA